MRRLCSVLCALGLFSCATAASYQQTCFAENKDFSVAANCLKQKIYEDPRSKLPTNSDFSSVLPAYIDVVTNKVEKKEITSAQGNLLIGEKISALNASQRSAMLENSLINSQINNNNSTTYLQDSYKPIYEMKLRQNQSTTCNMIGNAMYCNSY